MNGLFQTTLLGYSLMLLTLAGYADQTASDEGIYSYHMGQRAAGRFEDSATLTEEQIQQAVLGFESRLRNQPSRYTAIEIQQATETHHETRQLAQEILSQKNLIAGEKYLAGLEENLHYHFLEQGLAYKVNTTGTGILPQTNSQIRLQYIGKHLDGTEFDHSAKPVWQSIQGVLPGWRIALLNMRVGSQWTLAVPPHLAYGERGAPERIGPQETLIFELQLLGVR